LVARRSSRREHWLWAGAIGVPRGLMRRLFRPAGFYAGFDDRGLLGVSMPDASGSAF